MGRHGERRAASNVEGLYQVERIRMVEKEKVMEMQALVLLYVLGNFGSSVGDVVVSKG